MVHAVKKANDTVRVASEEHGGASRRKDTARWGHVSIDTSCPRRTLPLSVVGPGGPSRERAAVYIGKKGDLAAKEEVSNQKKKEKEKSYQQCSSKAGTGRGGLGVTS